VDSIVVKLNKLDKPSVQVKDEKLFFRISRDAFNMRRKTLWNAMKNLGLNSEFMNEAFNNAGIDPKRRGETLSLQEFANLADAVYELKR
jgi:16S rRNA (adenine1518-N6/adenine1519-N6)-dimethyltransferase